jgi:hypothetical protein
VLTLNLSARCSNQLNTHLRRLESHYVCFVGQVHHPWACCIRLRCQATFHLWQGCNLKWDLQQDEIQVKAARIDLAAPRGGQRTRRIGAPLKAIMVPVPKVEGPLFGSNIRHITPPSQSQQARCRCSSFQRASRRKFRMCGQGSALSPYLVLVVVPDDSGSVVGLPALESQSPVYIQGSSLFGACFTRGSGSL